ncbi:MAG: TonB-dependent receptor [Alistipes sp.]|jgi:hypothetical protein|nr:TonB-dependent receptor [Alistipes sp.]
MKIKRLLLVILCLAGVATVSRAQVTTSALGGRVTDSDGAAVIGATVVAVHTPTGTTYAAASDAAGNYRMRNMRPGGPYTVKFSYLGYATIEYNDIALVVADSRSLDARMESDATLIDDVVVVATTHKTSSGGGSVTEISTRDINLLPTTTRSIGNLLTLTPQASGEAIGGGNYRSNYLTIDGGSYNNMFGIGALPSGGAPVSLDAIEQMSVSLTPYDVRQSGFTGAAINAVTRSGSNEFVGSAYTYYRDEKFSGLRVGDQTLTRGAASAEKLFGVRLGGPILRNKLFFFGSFEYEPRTAPGPNTRVSTDGTADPDQNIVRPTAAELDEISSFLRERYGYETGPYQDYNFASPTTRILARLDWNINRNHKFTVRYSRLTTVGSPSTPSTSVSMGVGGWSTSPGSFYTSGNRLSDSAKWFKNSGYKTDDNYTGLAAELNSSFLDGRINNTLRFTYSDQDMPRSTDGGVFPFVDIKKDGTAFTSFGTELFSYGNLRKTTQWTITDDVSWSVGRHDMMAGFQFEHSNVKNGFMRAGTGWYVFESWEDFKEGRNPSSYAITMSTAPGFKQQFPSFNFNQYSLYFQDDIALSDRFDLTAGIRLDLPTYPAMSEIQTHPLIVAPEFRGVDGKGGIHYDTGTMPKSRVMFSPRVGFNWDIRGDKAYVLRGGTGIFTGRIPFVWIVAQSGDAGLLQGTLGWKGDQVPGPFNPDINAWLPATPPPPGTTIINTTPSVMDPDFRNPQTWKSSLAFDVQLPWGMKGSVEGIFNKEMNSVYIYKDGLSVPTALNVAGFGDHRLVYDGTYQHNVANAPDNQPGSVVDPSGTRGGLTPVVITNAPYDKSGHYGSITAKLEKPFDHGFSGMIAYTRSWGRSITDGAGDQAGSVWGARTTVNGANSLDMGYSGFVVPNRVVASASYRIEYAGSMATTVSLFYEGGNAGRFSYTYNQALTNDGGGNNLMYIPTAEEIEQMEFVPYTYTAGGETIEHWTAREQKFDFMDYIEQDKYLSKHQGQYAQRNGVVRPWESRFDVKIMQDFFVKTRSGKRNTIQVSIDILNAANLLNKHWGGGLSYYNTAILNITNARDVATKGDTPKYQMMPQAGTQNAAAKRLTRTYHDSFSFNDTYRFQIGIRYLFN